MPPKTEPLKNQLLRYVEDHIADTRRLPASTEIDKLFKESGVGQVRSALRNLVEEGKLKIAYEGRNNPTVYIPDYMYDALLRKQKEPTWIDDYSFEEAREIKEQIKNQEDQLTQLKMIESLLYATGRTLEEAAYEAFQVIGMKNLKATFDDPDMWDISFTHKGITYILDSKGKSKSAGKEDVAQLQLWIQKFVDDNPEAEPDELKGVLLINHYRDRKPSDRWPDQSESPPLTDAALRYLKTGPMFFLTTIDLFRITQSLLNEELTKTKAQGEVIKIMRRDYTNGG